MFLNGSVVADVNGVQVHEVVHIVPHVMIIITCSQNPVHVNRLLQFSASQLSFTPDQMSYLVTLLALQSN